MLIKETKVNQLHLTQDENKLPKIDIKSSYIHKWKKPFESNYEGNVQDVERIVELLTNDDYDASNYLEEYSWLICMKSHGELIGIYELGHGGLTSCVLDPREIFMKSSLIGATKIALVHNHPSGSPRPSKADIQLVDDIKGLLNIYGIYLYDSIIIGSNNTYFSMLKPTNEDIKEGNKIIHSTDFYKDTAIVDKEK